jgi:RNA polymerase sigma factor (sigma-70 family)
LKDSIFEKLSAKIYNENFTMLFNFFKKKGIYNQDINTELVHNTLTKCILTINKLKVKDSDSVKKWLYTIANNELIDHFRRVENNSDILYVGDINEEDLVKIIPSVIDNNDDLINEIENSLNKEDFKLINDYYINGYNFNELAKTYNRTPKAIKCKIYRIKDTLKKLELV